MVRQALINFFSRQCQPFKMLTGILILPDVLLTPYSQQKCLVYKTVLPAGLGNTLASLQWQLCQARIAFSFKPEHPFRDTQGAVQQIDKHR